MELPAPATLAIHDKEAAERWRVFKLAWESYSLARGVTNKDEDVQVATLLTVIGEDARTVYQTFHFDNAGDEKKIAPVLKKFEDYCQPRKHVPFARYLFHQRHQQVGESYEKYKSCGR